MSAVIAVHARIAGDSNYSAIIDLAATYMDSTGEKEDFYAMLKPCQYKGYTLGMFEGFKVTLDDLHNGSDYWQSLQDFTDFMSDHMIANMPVVVSTELVSNVIRQHKYTFPRFFCWNHVTFPFDLLGIAYTDVHINPSVPADTTAMLLAQSALSIFSQGIKS